jgi:hypothetical protein
MSIIFETFLSPHAGDAFIVLPTPSVLAFKGKRANITLSPPTVTVVGRHAVNAVVGLPALTVTATDVAAVGVVQLPIPAVLGYVFDTPNIAIGFAQPGVLTTTANGSFIHYGDAALTLDSVQVFGTNIPAYGIVRLAAPQVTAGFTNAFAHALLIAFNDPGFIAMAGVTAGEVLALDDGADFAVSMDFLTGLSFNETIVAVASLDVGGARYATMADVLAASDTQALISYLVMATTAAITDSPFAIDHNILLTLADALLISDDQLTLRHSLMTIAAIAVATDIANPYSIVDFAENTQATDALVALTQTILSMMDAVAATDSTYGLLSMLMVVDDNVAAADALDALRHALMGLDDSLFIGGRFVFDGIDYVVYAVQPIGAAVSEYTGWSFNSFATIDGKTYGANEHGLFLLEGDNDTGLPISAAVRTGLTNFGVSLTKAVPYVYIGYNGAGQMLLKAVTTAQGVKKENYYQLTPRARGASTNARFVLSKGLHSQYWGFELANVDGEDFDLDFVKAWVMALNRRV